MDNARPADKRPATGRRDMSLAGPADHPVIAMPFHVEIDGRQYQGRGISLVRAEIGGLIDPHLVNEPRIAWLVFQFHGFTVGLSLSARVQDMDPAQGSANLVFLEPLGDHLPQLRHLINAYIAGDLVTLGNALAVSPPLDSKSMAGLPGGRNHWLRRLGGTVLLVVATLVLLGLVGIKVYQRAYTTTLVSPAVAGFEGRTLAATATGQIDYLNPEAKPGEVAFAIRANTGQTLSVAMPCVCRVQLTGVQEGSTVFTGDPILRISSPEARIILTGTALPEEVMDLASAQGIELRFADGVHITARLAPGGLGQAAPGEVVPFSLIPMQPLPDDRLGQLAEVTLNRPIPEFLKPIAAVATHATPEAKADAP